jgi:ankyrin repeat protein
MTATNAFLSDVFGRTPAAGDARCFMAGRAWLFAAWILIPSISCAQNTNARLDAAIRANDVSAVMRLLNAGANPNSLTSSGTPMLILATNFAENTIVEKLLQRGARVEMRSARSLTALHAAAHWGRRDLVKRYLDRRADVTAQDESGATPLHSAAYGMQYDVIDDLIKRGADANAGSKLHGTPLILALRHNARNDRVPAIVALLRNGANPNIADSLGNFPLHLAIQARGGQPSVPAVQVLLDFKASPTATNARGESPIALAAASGNTDLLALFTATDRSKRPKGLQLQYPIGQSLVAGERTLYTIYLPYEVPEDLYIRVKLAGELAGQLRLESPGLVANTLPGWFWMRIPERSKKLSFHVLAPDSLKSEGTIGVSTAVVDQDGQARDATHLQMIIGINDKRSR